MKYLVRIFFLAIPLVIATAGCGGDPSNSTKDPETLTLYSIDGRDFEDGVKPKTEEEFHGYPVLGKVELKDLAKRKELMAALTKGIDESDGEMAKCFWPRHGIRAVKNGKTVDYVICFECLQLRIIADDTSKTEAITDQPQRDFNKVLKDAGVKLAPSKLDKAE